METAPARELNATLTEFQKAGNAGGHRHQERA